MGLRHTVIAYRCTDLEEFKVALSEAAEKLGGTFSTQKTPADFKTTLTVGVGPNAIAVYYPRGVFPFLREISFCLGGAPYLEARIQEGSHWDYSLYRGAVDLDQFSTYPQYWDGEEDPINSLYKKGRPEMLSLIFGVPEEKFNRYLRHWYSDWDEETEEYKSELEGKAYPEDRSPYCNYEQMWDFLTSLGIHDPTSGLHPDKFEWELVLPETFK